MFDFRINFERKNGTKGNAIFTAPTEDSALHDFHECYRHDNYTITSVEIITDRREQPYD